MTPRAWKRLFARILLWAALLVAAVLLLFLGTDTWSVYSKNQETANASAAESNQLSELQTRENTLSAQLNALNTARGMDAEMRETYPVAKSGEEVIVLTNTPPAATGGAKTSGGFWQWLTGLFSW